MANSFSNEIKSSSINFNSKSLLSNLSGWTINSGSGQIDSQIILNANSSCSLELNRPLQANAVKYLKILADITCEDKTLSTDSEHYLSVCYTINYGTNDIKDIVEQFFPKFDFEDLREDGIIGDFSIINMNDEVINKISITIYNDYDIPIIINNTGLYYCLSPVDEQYLNNYLNSEEYLNGLFNSWSDGLSTGLYDLVIPLVDTLPDINSVPDGYICRVNNLT